MSTLAHGGTVGVVFELMPMAFLIAVGLVVWRRQRRLATDDEARVEERGGSGE